MKFLPLTLMICEQLKAEGYNYLSIKSVYDEDQLYGGKTTVILKALKKKPDSYIVSLHDDNISSFLEHDKHAYCIMIKPEVPVP